MGLKVLSKYALFGILVVSSVLQDCVKIMSQKDQTVECAEFSVKYKLA